MVKQWVGIDVSKKRLDIYIRPIDEAFSCDNSPAEIAQLVKRLKAKKPALVVLEATGRLHIAVATAIAHAKIAIAVVNPRQIRDFAFFRRQISQDRSYRCSNTGALCRSNAAICTTSSQ
jgi:transposase